MFETPLLEGTEVPQLGCDLTVDFSSKWYGVICHTQ